MYKVLVIESADKDIIGNKHKIKYISKEKAKYEIEKVDYDLIFCKKEYLEEKLNATLLMNYTIIPKSFEKILKERATAIVYLNIYILNKVILENIKIIEFKDWEEEIAVAAILKQKLLGEMFIKNIYKKLSSNRDEKVRITKIIEKVIQRNYNATNFFRRCKYFLRRKNIQEKFWENLITNIDNDINCMEKV